MSRDKRPDRWSPEGVVLAVLEAYPPDCRPLGPVEALGNAGGFSGSKLWRFDAARGRLVLRAWPPVNEFSNVFDRKYARRRVVERESSWLRAPGMLPGSSGVEQVHHWLRAAEGIPFVPRPLRASDGKTLQSDGGLVWDLSPWMPGVADLARPPAIGHVQAAFRGMASFHRQYTPERVGPSPGIAARLADLERWVGGEFARVRDRLAPVGVHPKSDLARAWIDRAAPRVGPVRVLLGSILDVRVPIQPCLRDARPDHFLFEGGRLTGLVDFGAMGLDAVSVDLARLSGEWFGPDRALRVVALEAYRSVRPLSEDEARLIPVFEAANALLGAGRWVRWYFQQNRRFEDPDAFLNGLRRGIERLEEADLSPPPGLITS